MPTWSTVQCVVMYRYWRFYLAIYIPRLVSTSGDKCYIIVQ